MKRIETVRIRRGRAGIAIAAALPMLIGACGSSNSRNNRLGSTDPRLYGAAAAGYGAAANRYGNGNPYQYPYGAQTQQDNYSNGARYGAYSPYNTGNRNALMRNDLNYGAGNTLVVGNQPCTQGMVPVRKNPQTGNLEAVGSGCPEAPANNGNGNTNTNTNTAALTEEQKKAAEEKQKAASIENGVIGSDADSYAVAAGICTTEQFNGPDSDHDGVSDKCEELGKALGYGMSDGFFNGYKVAAATVKVPQDMKRWWDLFEGARQAKETRKGILDLTKVSSLLLNGANRYETFFALNSYFPLPNSSIVGLVRGGNGEGNRLTLGGVSDVSDAGESFDACNLPGMRCDEKAVGEKDGFVYVIEGFLNYPSRLTPVLEIRGSTLGSERVSGIVVSVNDNIMVRSFDKKPGTVANDFRTGLGTKCAGVDCHLVAVLYMKEKANKGGHQLVESLLINMDPKDGRGFEPLPTEIAGPLPRNPGFNTAVNGEHVIKIMASPTADSDLIRTCKLEATLSTHDLQDLTMCAALFKAREEAADGVAIKENY